MSKPIFLLKSDVSSSFTSIFTLAILLIDLAGQITAKAHRLTETDPRERELNDSIYSAVWQKNDTVHRGIFMTKDVRSIILQ